MTSMRVRWALGKMPILGRWFPRRPTRIYWVPKVADYRAPSREELDAGFDLTSEITKPVDWLPPYGLRARLAKMMRKPRIVQEADSTLEFYSAEILEYLPRDITGHLATFQNGDYPKRRMSIFPAAVANVWNLESRCVLLFAFTERPAIRIPIPKDVE